MLTLPSSSRRLLALAIVLGLAACEFPTQPPKWNTRWVIPGDSTTIEASSFFPSGVETSAEGDAFLFSVPGAQFQRTLGEMCGSICQAANGAVVPKPAFTATFGTTVALPPDVISASIAGGTIDVRLSHNLSFDPIRPGTAARGSIVITAASGETTLARETISGTTTAFAPNTVLSRTLRLAPGTVSGPITVAVTASSPAGDPVRIDTNQRISVDVTPGEVRASGAQVRFTGSRTVAGDPVEVGLGDLDSEMSSRVKEATVRLRVDNPFAVQGTLRLTFDTGSGTVTKTAPAGPGLSEAGFTFTQEEVRLLFESPEVVLVASGTFSAPSGAITVRPGQSIGVQSRLELLIGPES